MNPPFLLQFGDGDTLAGVWHYGATWPKWEWAIAALRHVTRTEELYAWRLIEESTGRTVVMICPGEKGAA